jgi:hypothetical protein
MMNSPLRVGGPSSRLGVKIVPSRNLKIESELYAELSELTTGTKDSF